jgi:hypothetical protein
VVRVDLPREWVQRGSVADQPDMTEWIGEPTLAMDPPWSRVILDVIETADCGRFQCAGDHRVRVVTEQFNPDRGGAYFLWAIPVVLGWPGEEEGFYDIREAS